MGECGRDGERERERKRHIQREGERSFCICGGWKINYNEDKHGKILRFYVMLKFGFYQGFARVILHGSVYFLFTSRLLHLRFLRRLTRSA